MSATASGAVRPRVANVPGGCYLLPLALFFRWASSYLRYFSGSIGLEPRVLQAMKLPFDAPELAPARARPGGSELQSLQLGW